MSLTVELLYKHLEPFGAELVAGQEGNQLRAEWIHIVESLTSTQAVEKHELVIIDGQNIQTESGLLEVVISIVEQQASGILLPLYAPLKKVPGTLLRYCNEKKLPLITLPGNVAISQLTRMISRELLESEKASRQLFSALKNAISFPQKKDLYQPTLLQYGFQDKSYYTLAVIDMVYQAQMEEEEVQGVVKTIEGILMSAGDKSFVLNMDGILILMFADYSRDRINTIMLKILSSLRANGIIFFAGCGQTLQDVVNISKSYIQAKRSIDLAKKLNWKNILVDYDDLGIYKLLLAMEENGVQEEFYNEKFGQLVLHDQANKTNFAEVLTVYLENDCNINTTADKMFVHRNTIVYKIKKIEELLDCDLSELEVRVQLYVAMIIKNII